MKTGGFIHITKFVTTNLILSDLSFDDMCHKKVKHYYKDKKSNLLHKKKPQ